MADNIDNFVERFLETKEMTVHRGVMKSEFVSGLDRAIEKGPNATRKYYQNYADNLSETLNLSGLSERERDQLNDSDLQIIEFFTEKASKPGLEEIINISGVLMNVLELTDDLELKSYCITPNIESTAYFWIYLNIYELILDTMTKNLLKYYQNEGVRESQISYLEKKVENGEHLTTRNLESELSGLGIIEDQNDSIFSEDRSRFMRNKLGHANVFFDTAENEIVFTDGTRYSFEEFKKEYEIILQFALEWIYRLSGDNPNIGKEIENTFNQITTEINRGLLKFSRSDGNWNEVLLEVLDE